MTRQISSMCNEFKGTITIEAELLGQKPTTIYHLSLQEYKTSRTSTHRTLQSTRISKPSTTNAIASPQGQQASSHSSTTCPRVQGVP